MFAAPSLRGSMTCEKVFDLFSEDPDLLLLPVVDGDIPIGLVTRQEFLVQLADRFGRALFAQKPITALMDAKPLIVDVANCIDNVSQFIVAENPNALLSGFILTRDGRYAGVCTALSLLQANIVRLRRRTEQLDIARRDAEQASRSKSEFLANVSHELRTPLNAIIGFADLVLMAPNGPISPPKYAEYVNDIKSSGSHLLNLINDILDMSRVEAGKLDLHCAEFDPHGMVHGAARMVAHTLKQAGHELIMDVPKDLPDVCADERLVRQMLINLMSNAIKFTEPGGRITVKASIRNSDMLELSVSDTGIGIPDFEIENVMKPFRQLDNSFTRRHAGTGLGLPLVNAMARAHGGSFKLQSVVNVGTTATLLLPIVVTAAQAVCAGYSGR